ncbi:ABC transporter substrate-binding protein [Gorillibacterium timonense]|uniref:ABC transporter substrate-binding protein n=1 Tax=Gorillibacterium timonense TaxID=1689269 RepID=UPI00071CA2F4|nr:ABC transporter substrate-binding protein [Gorillibacterium timonense]
MKKVWMTVSALTLMVALSACGNTTKSGSSEPAATSTATAQATAVATAAATTPVETVTYPVTIQNFKKAEGGTTWEAKEQVFDKAPERIMANTRPAAELLLHLGLGDRIVGVGANFGAPDKSVEAEYAKLNILSDSYVGKEVTLGTNPDLVFGRGGLFDNADWGVGTVDSINSMGIKTYVLESSITGGTYNSIYKDIENAGEIFNVKEKADEFIQELKNRQEAIASKLAGIKEEKTFAYLHMSDPKQVYVYAAGKESFFNDSFKMVKLNNAFENVDGEVSVEKLIETNPDVLIIPDWEGGAEAIKEALYANPQLTSMKAIQNKQIYAVDYNYMFGYGYNTIDGMELLAKEMYPDLFK